MEGFSCIKMLKKKKKKGNFLKLPLCSEKAVQCTLMPPTNLLAQSAKQSESTEQMGFLPAGPAQFCLFCDAQQ